MKTTLTIEMELSLYAYCVELGAVVVEEVTMPEDKGIVDTLSCFMFPDGKREWRCYELKVSKADFRSAAKLSFIGHYNYYVLPKSLYEQVMEEIPREIGVLVYRPYVSEEKTDVPGTFSIVKKPQRKELEVEEEALTNRFMASLFREVRKAKRMEKGVRYFPTEELYKELKNRTTFLGVAGESLLYETFKEELENQAVTELTEELTALKKDYEFLKNRQTVRRRATEPLE
ncbi:hypothetical protein RV11_GL002246 [Enterococcus phoeniculicola]|jgi:hypothetical protein|uniref:Uncharacterized protein n=1 Tax=Enterococcus phoeniculicola ATCC BAA-412 TaxID=1158610 RepID=R3WPP3_9ENTE|nr:hypothetical protein [Enterococcus phoeniculicola]EOL43805.1 hypothetical protein UC3_01786 [Enterococcus phoeniculicola ATCC BAA-412]EOT76831.1 hypothetical protein I589_01789 [Enterococcus phoeniculicola ATCC BAA-412]OJG69720.1 hypothetical protein RV11_GL002246 [Enterococcus phoeniculicola]